LNRIEEVTKAIQLLASNKVPGDDGFSVHFYKTLIDTVIPDKLLKVYHKTKERGPFPKPLNFSIIALLPKPNNNLLECSSYRPIQLLNMNNKIFGKILAGRLDVTIINRQRTNWL
uniref:Reverse transcriptase domain-containing protein n=1 Tax=Salmo trutta TaxID=8032 RepID=A0A674A953_SALTR